MLLATIMLGGCGNSSSSSTEKVKNTEIESVDAENSESANENSKITETDSSLETRVIKSEDFIFGNFARMEDTVMNEDGERFYNPNTFSEWVGFNYENDTLHFIIRKNLIDEDNLNTMKFNFTAVTDKSEEHDVESYLAYEWKDDIYNYQYFVGTTYNADKILRLDFDTNEEKEYMGENNITKSINIADLKNDQEVQQNIGDFEFNQIHEANLSNEVIEFSNEDLKIDVTTIDYFYDKDNNMGIVSMDVEVLSSVDGDIDSTLYFPYRNFDEHRSESVEDDSFFADIPKKIKLQYREIPYISLEDSLIIEINGITKHIGFEAPGTRMNPTFNIPLVNLPISVPTSEIKEFKYAVRDWPGRFEGSLDYPLTIETQEDGVLLETIELSGIKGTIDPKKYGPEVVIGNSIFRNDYEQIVDYTVTLDDFDILLQPTGFKN